MLFLPISPEDSTSHDIYIASFIIKLLYDDFRLIKSDFRVCDLMIIAYYYK